VELVYPTLQYGDWFGSLQEPIVILIHDDPLPLDNVTLISIVHPGAFRSSQKRCQNIFILYWEFSITDFSTHSSHLLPEMA